MCGRFTLTTPEELIAEAFGLEDVPKLSARYNIAPTQEVAAVVQPASGRQLAMFRWGLLAPGEAESDDLMLINVRSETAATKPLFREAFRSRRCLIPADGFYEWRKAGKRREPFHVRLRDRRPFAFAGLWTEQAGDAGQAPVKACAILTTGPNALMAGIHDRMPAILAPATYGRWLDSGERATREARELLSAYPAEAMEAVRVSSYVNAASAEGPRCLEPERQGSLFD